MKIKQIRLYSLALFSVLSTPGFASDIADAVMRGEVGVVRDLISRQVDVNEPQVDGATALHWAVRWDDLQTARMLIEAGADADIPNRTGARPMQLAAINGDAVMLSLLLEAGADPNALQTETGDTALMLAARTGIPEAVQILLDYGADINARESWGGTTALMWAVAENNAAVVELLVDNGADVNAQSSFITPDTSLRSFESGPQEGRRPEEVGPVQHASGEFTPLMLAARQGYMESARLLVDSGADLNAIAADGKDALGLAIFNGNYEFAAYMIDQGAEINQADARGFTALFWAVDRRNMETAMNFPWMVTEDPLPLVKKLLDAGADPNKLVDDTPRARMRGGSPRIVFATALMRAAFSGDLELVQLLLDYGADPHIKSSDNETALGAASGLGFIMSFHKERPMSERLEVIKLLVELGSDVNWQDDYGISPLMAAANLGDIDIIQYLIDQGADLGAHDLGKKNNGSFGASIEPLMPLDYAISVGTFRPNNAVVFNTEAVDLMTREMEKRGIKHTTSECTLRGFTCSAANMDPRNVTAAVIERARDMQIGHQVTDLTAGKGLAVENEE